MPGPDRRPSKRRLTYKKLTPAEQREYVALVNRFYELSPAESNKAKADEHLQKAARIRSLIVPIGMTYHMVASLYFRLCELTHRIREWREVGEPLEPGNAVHDYGEFFKQAKLKYGCATIDWKTFPGAPWTPDWL